MNILCSVMLPRIDHIAMTADTLRNLKINPDTDLDCHVFQGWQILSIRGCVSFFQITFIMTTQHVQCVQNTLFEYYKVNHISGHTVSNPGPVLAI